MCCIKQFWVFLMMPFAKYFQLFTCINWLIFLEIVSKCVEFCSVSKKFQKTLAVWWSGKPFFVRYATQRSPTFNLSSPDFQQTFFGAGNPICFFSGAVLWPNACLEFWPFPSSAMLGLPVWIWTSETAGRCAQVIGSRRIKPREENV